MKLECASKKAIDLGLLDYTGIGRNNEKKERGNSVEENNADIIARN